mgnify:CR=1 FL=1
MLSSIPHPEEGEYTPYTITYISLVPDDGEIIKHLKSDFADMKKLVESLPADKLTTPRRR